MLRRQLRKQFAEEKHSIEEDIENFLNSVDVEGHSSNWNNFISKCKKQKSSDHDTNTNIVQHEQPTQLHELTAVSTLSATFICYLCERKFSSLEKQERHVAESAMHLKNLQLLQKEQNSWAVALFVDVNASLRQPIIPTFFIFCIIDSVQHLSFIYLTNQNQIGSELFLLDTLDGCTK